MGARKKIAADLRKEAKKSVCEAKAVGVPTSPRKMRLLADILRGKDILDSLNILTFSTKHASKTIEKLLRSAISNWEQKFESKADESELYIAELKVDSGRMLKRFQPAPQGRAYRIRKRSNHITLKLASRKAADATITTEENNAN
jgi:large subunit ribosomal protein L22